MDILVLRKKNQNGCHQTDFTGSKYTENILRSGRSYLPVTPLGMLTALLRHPSYGLGCHLIHAREEEGMIRKGMYGKQKGG